MPCQKEIKMHGVNNIVYFNTNMQVNNIQSKHKDTIHKKGND